MSPSIINNGDSGLVARNKINAGLLSINSITRLQIPSTIITNPVITLSGFYNDGDLGYGAVYTSVGASSNGIMAIQDASGTWFQMLLNNGPVNLGWFGLIKDGVSDNIIPWQTLNATSYLLSQTLPSVTITISIGSPATITLANHGFLQGIPVTFFTTGTLPTGLVAGQTYWVTNNGLTQNTFQVTAEAPTSFGPPRTSVNTSGSQSGTQSLVVYGQEWIEAYLPPGNYVATDNGFNFPLTQNGNKKARVNAYGAVTFAVEWGGSNALDPTTPDGSFNNVALIQSQGTSPNTNSVTLINSADSSKFHLNQWVCLMALDMQGPQSWPPNYHYFEYQKITSINSGTGVIGFNNIVRSAYNQFYPGYGPIVLRPGVNFLNAGAAMIVGMHPYWDVEVEVNGVHTLEPGQDPINGKYIKITDCTFLDQGLIPTFNKRYVAERCHFGNSCEVDKLIEYALYKHCDGPGLFVQSSSVDTLVIDGCNFDLVTGTAKREQIINSNFGELTVGPLFFGVTESLVIEDSKIISFRFATTFFSDPTILGQFNLVENCTWSGGTFSKPLTAGPIAWAIPGSKAFIKPYAPSTGANDNIGSPFAIIAVRTDGVNTLVDTTLTGKPVGNSTNATVTITIGNPTVINWAGHGLIANTPVTFLTTGTLPTGMPPNVYYVLAAGLGANSFEFSTSPGGPPVATSGSQSGTQTAIANPLQFLSHPCPRLTIRGCTGSPTIVAMSDGPSELPIYSYFRRLYTGDSGSISGAGPTNVVQPYAWGKLISLTINVIKAYTGATNPLTLTITANGWTDALLAGNLTEVIDMRTTGLRTITQTTATGSVGADTIAAFANWISGAFKMVFNADVANDTTAPLFEIEVYTDQGITKYNMIQYFDNNLGMPVLLADTDTDTR